MSLCTKEQWLTDFREHLCSKFPNSSLAQKERSKIINSEMSEYRNQKLQLLKQTAKQKKWTDLQLIDEIMLMTYTSYIVSLEFRNKVWPYEYMTFTRRIGEFWEPFCRLAFEYPLKKITIVKPPKFEDIQKNIQKGATDYIDSLQLPSEIKEELKLIYEIPWTMVDSGGIKLELDLHFTQNMVRYNCDFKSGFSSNEKGNTNRLLLVGSIYNFLGAAEKTLLFVRQQEEDNNHYLKTLKNSKYWKVYCADECYSAIKQFTGVDIRLWLDTNANWEHDMSSELHKTLETNDLLKYLNW